MARHALQRKPRFAQFAATSVALSTAAVAFAPAAQAAPLSDWDRLAQCEASGNWSINTGNGFFGGLQFTRSTWLAYGGGKYAPYAHQATRLQQIEIAEKVLAGQGWGAWPACSSRLGLNSAPESRPAPEAGVEAISSELGGSSTPEAAQPVADAEVAPNANQSEDVDAVYELITNHLTTTGTHIPTEVQDFYKANRDQFVNLYSGARELVHNVATEAAKR